MADDSKDTNELLATAREEFRNDQADEQSLRGEFSTNVSFECGDGQWDERVKQDRIKNNRPVLTFNRMHTFVQQVANEARQNKSEIKFSPAENGDKETAEIYEGLARHIQYNSKARVAYETALEYAASGGWGYFRFLPDYVDEESFDQEINVVPVMDPLSVYGVLIPTCFDMEPDHAFVVEEIPVALFKQQYPDSVVAELGFDEFSRQYEGWAGTDTIRVAEYWKVVTKSETIKSEDGKRERTVLRKSVKFCKINGAEVLPGTETEWLGKRIPIFTVLGKLRIDQGKPKLFSVITHQRDAQRLINFYKTRIAETLGTAPIQPYMVAKGQIAEEDKGKWATANQTNHVYLEYEQVGVGGQPADKPQRQVFEPPIMALSNAAAQEIDDLKATSGIYDASMGNKSNESSGIALARRQQQADITNMHFMDNLERAYQESGRELAYVMPKYYDAARQVRILGVDEQPKIVKINQQFIDESGQPRHYKIGGDGVGKYDTIISMGKTYSSKRMESFDMMGQIVQANPNILPMIGDVLFKNSDVAGADQLAERFQKMLPPNLQEQPEGQQQIPPQVQQQMAQMDQMVQQLTAALNEAQDALKGKTLDIESRERIEMARMQLDAQLNEAKLAIERQKVQADIMKTQATLDSQEAIALLKAELDGIKSNMQMNMQQAAQSAGDAAQQM